MRNRQSMLVWLYDEYRRTTAGHGMAVKVGLVVLILIGLGAFLFLMSVFSALMKFEV